MWHAILERSQSGEMKNLSYDTTYYVRVQLQYTSGQQGRMSRPVKVKTQALGMYTTNSKETLEQLGFIAYIRSYIPSNVKEIKMKNCALLSSNLPSDIDRSH